MTIRDFRNLFVKWDDDHDDEMAGWYWVTGREEAALIDPLSGKMLAYIEHDGYGKFYPVLALPVLQAIRVCRREVGRVISLRSFPRVTVELFRFKTDSLTEVQEIVQTILFGGNAAPPAGGNPVRPPPPAGRRPLRRFRPDPEAPEGDGVGKAFFHLIVCDKSNCRRGIPRLEARLMAELPRWVMGGLRAV